VEQTGRSFTVSFNEHKNAFETITLKTLQNTSLNRHTHSTPSVTQCKYYNAKTKGSHVNTLERLYIYTEHLKNNHLNDDHAMFPNMIFEALLKPHQP
jgi:hypothetical protein